jgi:hypothetical protein
MLGTCPLQDLPTGEVLRPLERIDNPDVGLAKRGLTTLAEFI